MIIYIDENMAPQLAEGLNLLQIPENVKLKEEVEVRSIKKEFGMGAQDEDWLPKIGEEGSCVITRDLNIQRTRHQRELYMKYGVGIFFLAAGKKGLSYWESVKLLIKTWEQIVKYSTRKQRPFAFRLKSNGKLEELT
ncbi:MAG: hypothetical protein RLQ12_05710 [Cyclobacteriaceae bacterium]